MAVFDLHVHTTYGSGDSGLTPDDLAARASEIGLDGVCLTEHSGGWTLDAVREAFEGSGVTAIAGLEVETDMGHVLVYGIRTYVNGMHRARDLRKAVDEAGGVMVSAHPFRNLFNQRPHSYNLLFKDPDQIPGTAREAVVHPIFGMVDAIEVANGANTDHENRFALEAARHLGLGGTGGSDAHSLHGLGSCVTVFDGDVTSDSDLIEAIRSKAFSADQRAHLKATPPESG